MGIGLYFALAIPPMLAGFAAHFWVRRTFDRASRRASHAGARASVVATRLLHLGGVRDVTVATTEDEGLTDHYDPGSKTIRLSAAVGDSESVGALAVASHEAGHALQDAEGERGFRLMRALRPAALVSSYGWIVLFGVGLWSESIGLVQIAVAVFAVVIVFQVAALPVEIGASRRALRLLADEGILTADELPIGRRVLTAAAMTYVVAALIAIVELARIALMVIAEGED
jgi:uncharacterized protein